MSKGKLRKFEENKTFPNMIQVSYEELERQGEYNLKGRWKQDFFKNNNPIVLELGCGKGEYTLGLGRKHPNKNYIGVDIKGARMWNGCKKSVEEGLKNIAFLRTHIQHLDKYFAKDEVDEIWITFCDPQLKKPRRRLTHPRYLELYSMFLVEGGRLHLKTDSYELYDFTLNEVLIPDNHRVIFHSSDLYSLEEDLEVKEIQTFYEEIYLSENKPITYIEFEINRENYKTNNEEYSFAKFGNKTITK